MPLVALLAGRGCLTPRCVEGTLGAEMRVRFIGTHLNKVDSKGRVSVPAPFRTVIERASGGNRRFFYRPDPERPAIECFTDSLWDEIDHELEQLELGSQARELKQYEWYGTSSEVEFDNEGRIVLPRKLAEQLALKDQATFVGYGTRFKIWCPERLEEYHAGLKLGGPIRPTSPAGGP